MHKSFEAQLTPARSRSRQQQPSTPEKSFSSRQKNALRLGAPPDHVKKAAAAPESFMSGQQQQQQYKRTTYYGTSYKRESGEYSRLDPFRKDQPPEQRCKEFFTAAREQLDKNLASNQTCSSWTYRNI